MIHSSTKIHILDINEKISLNATIADVYRNFSRFQKHVGDRLVVDLSNENVVIKDWTGWTKLYKMEKIEKKAGEKDIEWDWIERLEPHDFLFYDTFVSDAIIPVYSKDISRPGFHGEVKYKYILKEYHNLKEMNQFTMRLMLDSENWQKFISVHLEPLSPNYVFENASIGYEIYTKSGFYNANGFHLCSSDTRIEDSKELYK